MKEHQVRLKRIVSAITVIAILMITVSSLVACSSKGNSLNGTYEITSTSAFTDENFDSASGKITVSDTKIVIDATAHGNHSVMEGSYLETTEDGNLLYKMSNGNYIGFGSAEGSHGAIVFRGSDYQPLITYMCK